MGKTIDKFNASVYQGFFSVFNSHTTRLVGLLPLLLKAEPQKVWDLACGVGLSTLSLNQAFPKSQIRGIDIDSNLIELAQKSISNCKIKFQNIEISEAIEQTQKGTLDLIFVKSAYHYFEHQITLQKLKPLLSPQGAIVIAERTPRSAKSYPLPEIASSYWTNIFSSPRDIHRFEAASEAGLSLSVSCYGENLTVAASDYLQAVKENQLVGLWMLKPEIVQSWVFEHLAQQTESFEIFEEFWLYIYHL